MFLANLNEREWLRGRKLTALWQESGSFKKVFREVGGEVENTIEKRYLRKGINLIPFWSEFYPVYLNEVSGKPLLLYVKGNFNLLKERMVALVGTRNPSRAAKDKIRMVLGRFKGAVVVSGLARGTDRLAHEKALVQKLPTVAVLGHGLQMIYPLENEQLAEEIITQGGALVSELPWGVTPKRNYFLERNRIMVGMSEAVVIIEGELRSGSMSSANHGAEMGREVYAVRGSPLTDLLLEEGALELFT